MSRSLAYSLALRGLGALARAWPLVIASVVAVGLGWAFTPTGAVAPRALFLFLGVLLAGIAVSRRLQAGGQSFEERAESAALLAVASLVALLARVACDSEWGSAQTFLSVLFAVGLFGSALVLLPRLARRIVAVLLVFFHFGGILTAVTAIQPRDQPSPWLSVQIFNRVYRPYLTFMYLTNAYHFYSPDPGPPSLLWFRVNFKDDTYRWVKLPVRTESPIALHYQRFLALAESTNLPMPRPPFTEAEKAEYERAMGVKYDHDTWEDIYQRRQLGATGARGIDIPVDLAPNQQYSEPQDYAKLLIASYARHVARTQDKPVKSVRVYRVTHRLISPGEYAEGFSPLRKTFYSPIYVGMFDTDGNLMDPKDPLLYWYIPIVNVQADYPGQPKSPVPLVAGRGYMPSSLVSNYPGDKIYNGVALHSGDSDTALEDADDKR